MAASKKSTDTKTWILGSGLFLLVAGFLTSTVLVGQSTDNRSAAYAGRIMPTPVAVATPAPAATPKSGRTTIIKGTQIKPVNSTPAPFNGTPRQGLK